MTGSEPTGAAASADTKPRNTLKFASGFMKPNTLSHLLLWREGSSLTYSVILATAQWAVTLHNLPREWHPIALIAVVFVVGMVSAWYPAAQSNAIQYAMREEGVLDPAQVNRDFGWSLLPALVIGAMYLLSVVGLCLHWFTDVIDQPSTMWIRDRLILSPVMAAYSLVVLWSVKVDLGNNQIVLSQIVHLAGRLRRIEEAH